MTDAQFPIPDDADLAAAEYVLGVTDAAARAAFERRLRDDPALQAQVLHWEARFAGLNDAFTEVPAPDLLPALEVRLFGSAPSGPSRLASTWAWLTGGLAIAALALAAFLVLEPTGPQPTLGTTLAAEAQALRIEARLAGGDLTVSRVAGPEAEAGRTYQLWLIAGEAAPVPLGLLRGERVVIPREGLLPGMVLAVSLEPAGGSTTGLPTGPVLVTGTLAGI